MKRDVLKEIFAEAGIEVNGAVITNIMNTINEEIRNVKVETANKIMADYDGYLSPDEVSELKNEISNLKDSSAKVTRTSKYKESKIADKWHDLADSKLKDSNNFDEDLKKFVKDNPELLIKETTPKQQIRFTNLADSKNESANQDSSSRMNAFIRGTNEE